MNQDVTLDGYFIPKVISIPMQNKISNAICCKFEAKFHPKAFANTCIKCSEGGAKLHNLSQKFIAYLALRMNAIRVAPVLIKTMSTTKIVIFEIQFLYCKILAFYIISWVGSANKVVSY